MIGAVPFYHRVKLAEEASGPGRILEVVEVMATIVMMRRTRRRMRMMPLAWVEDQSLLLLLLHEYYQPLHCMKDFPPAEVVKQTSCRQR